MARENASRGRDRAELAQPNATQGEEEEGRGEEGKETKEIEGEMEERGARRKVKVQQVLSMYEGTSFQTLVALLILASFAVDLGEAEVLPQDGSKQDVLFQNLGIFFTV